MSKDTTRMIIGFGIIVVMLIVWQSLFRPKPRPATQATQPAIPAETVETQPAPPEPETTRLAKPDLPEPVPFAAAETETAVVLENDLLRLEFTNLGGALRSARLKRYDAELVAEGTALLGTELLTRSAALDLSGTLMHTRTDGWSVSFSLVSDSVEFRKTFTLEQDYGLVQSVSLRGADGYVVRSIGGIAVTEKEPKEDLPHFHFYARTKGKVNRYAVKNLKQPLSLSDPADWVALKSKYFFLAAISKEDGFDSSFAVALDDGRVGFKAAVRPAGPESRTTFYIGPLDYNRLRSYGLGFEDAVSLGWAKPIALGILWLLRLLYRIFGNWGVAIIVFSIIMKAAFFPLTRTQTRQMRQMQQLQPKLNELKQKYKNEPQKLNQETMQLYKLYKINPLSGCLPMLVQLPVFWALYSVLRTFIDLRGARFVFWLKDLSQPDTLFGHLPFLGNPAIGLLPILMGVSFIAQNLLTSTDKRNWALTIIFPIFITVIFLNFPSGLQLYWFMYNILSILESIIGLKGGKSWRKARLRSKKELSPATARSQ